VPLFFPWLTIALKRAMSSAANTPEEHQRQQEYLRDFLTLFQNATKEARYGVVLQDMRVVVDVLNRLDSLLHQVEIRFGLDHQPISSPLPIADGAGALRVQLRLEPLGPACRRCRRLRSPASLCRSRQLRLLSGQGKSGDARMEEPSSGFLPPMRTWSRFNGSCKSASRTRTASPPAICSST
jgi:hypothetical protein